MSKFPTVTFRDYDENTIQKGLELTHVQQVVFDKLYVNLVESISKKRKKVILCRIKKAEEILYKPKFQIIIKQNDFKTVRDYLLDYYTKLEDYDKCVKLRDLEV